MLIDFYNNKNATHYKCNDLFIYMQTIEGLDLSISNATIPKKFYQIQNLDYIILIIMYLKRNNSKVILKVAIATCITFN